MDEVTDVMRTNMTRILEREGKLGELELRADQLQTDSQQFQVLIIKNIFNFFFSIFLTITIFIYCLIVSISTFLFDSQQYSILTFVLFTTILS